MTGTSVHPDLLLRRRILPAAAAEFAHSGFDAARLASIAAAAGVDLPELNRLMPGKKNVYSAVLLDVLSEALATVGTAVAIAPSPEARLRAAVAGITAVASENPHFAPLLLREIASGGAALPTSAVAHMQLLSRILTHILSRGAAGGVFRPVDPLVTLMALAGSLLVIIAGAPIADRIRGGDDDAAPPLTSHLARAISDLLLDGVRPHFQPARLERPHRQPTTAPQRPQRGKNR